MFPSHHKPGSLHSTLTGGPVSDARTASFFTIQSQHAMKTMLCPSTLPRGLLPGTGFITQNVRKCTLRLRSNIAARTEHMYGARMSVLPYLVIHTLPTLSPPLLTHPIIPHIDFASRCTLGLRPLLLVLFVQEIV